MTIFTEAIKCIDCNAERMITRACLNLILRCKTCQKEFNKSKARNRYRGIKGIPFDGPIAPMIVKKELKKAVVILPKPQVDPPAKEEAKEKPQKTKVSVDPVTETKRKEKAIERLLRLFGQNEEDVLTEKDW